MVDVNLDFQIEDMFFETVENFICDLRNIKNNNNKNIEDLNNSNATPSIYNSLINNETEGCESAIETKQDLNIDGQNCINLSHDKKTEVYLIEEKNDPIVSNKYKTNVFRDLSLARVQTDGDLNTEFNIRTAFKDSSDSGFSSQNTIEYNTNVLDNARNLFPIECTNMCNTKEDKFNTINVTHIDVNSEGGNFEQDYTLGNSFEDLDSGSHCSGYHSSDFEFIDENEAKDFNINLLDANVVNTNYFSSKECLTSTENRKRSRSKSFSNCRNHFIPEGDDFLVLFQTAPVPNSDEPCLQNNCYKLVPSITRSSLGFEIEKFRECKDSEDEVTEAKETENNILTKYLRQNRYYKK